MKKTNDEQKSMIEVKKDIWSKIKMWFKKKLYKDEEIIEEKVEQKSNNSTQTDIIDENTQDNKIETQKEETKSQYIKNPVFTMNPIIVNAREAYEEYVTNAEYEISEKLYDFVTERIIANQDNIESIIEIENTSINYNDIIEILKSEKENLQDFKTTIESKKIDDKFVFSQYKIPYGVISVASNDSKIAIHNIFKAITTRNAILIVQENYNEYSLENLILLIVKECLKKFEIDDNIIQIIKRDDINSQDLKDIDVVIGKNGTVVKKQKVNKMYIYLEDIYFEDIVTSEINKLQENKISVELIEGDFEECIEKINSNRNYAVSIYSQDRKKGYKFINLINSDNVFFNSTLLNAKKVEEIDSNYFTLKNIICSYEQ